MKNTKITIKEMLFTSIIALTVSSALAQNNNALWQGIGPDTQYFFRNLHQ